MKNKTHKIISLVIAVIAGAIDYTNFTVIKSLCYYAGDGHENFQELRDICYARYSNSRLLFEIILVFLIFYLIVFYGIKVINHVKKKYE